MGDAWGGDVSAYRREGEVELGPTTWLYFDCGCTRFGTLRCAAISVSAQDKVSQFRSETCGRGWSVPCVSIQLTLSQSLYNTVPHRALRAHPAAGSPSGTPAPPAPGSSRSSVIETLWPYLHPACRLGVIPVALMAIWRYCRNTQGTFVSY